MRTLLTLLVALAGSADGLLSSAPLQPATWAVLRPFSGDSLDSDSRSGASQPPSGNALKIYLATPSLGGSRNRRLPDTILLKRITAAGSARGRRVPPGRAGKPAPLAASRRVGWPARGARPLPRRRQGTRRPTAWVFPSAESSLAPAGHWEGFESPDVFEPLGERSVRKVVAPAAPDGKRASAPSSRRTPAPSGKRTPAPPAPSGKRTPAPPAPPAPGGKRKLTPGSKRAPTANTRRTPSAKRPASGGDQRPAAAGHASVDVSASVVYPGARAGAAMRRPNDVIYDAAVDPGRAASQLSPGRGFRLRPQTVQYGGWVPIVE